MIHLNARYAPALASLLLATLHFQCAWAQAPTTDADADRVGTQWGIGLGIGAQRKAYTGIGNTAEVLPLLVLENHYVRIFGPVVDAKLPSVGPVFFTLRGRFSFDGYKASDAPILNGMDTRKAAFWMGGTAIWHTEIANLSAEAVADVASPHKGTQFRLGAEREFEAGRFSITPRASAVWLGRRYVDYYYGVRSSEALPTRPQYDGRSTVNAEFGLRATCKLAPRQMVFFDLSATRLGTAIKNSPLVDRTTQTSARVGYLYRF